MCFVPNMKRKYFRVVDRLSHHEIQTLTMAGHVKKDKGNKTVITISNNFSLLYNIALGLKIDFTKVMTNYGFHNTTNVVMQVPPDCYYLQIWVL